MDCAHNEAEVNFALIVLTIRISTQISF